MHPNPRRVLPVVVVILALLGLGYWYFFGGGRAGTDTGAIAAAGTIEATTINVSPELGGRVAEVKVREGDKVSAGDVLIQFDTTLLTTQRGQVAAALVAAQSAQTAAQSAQAAAEANYNLLKAGPSAEQLGVAQAAVNAAQVAVDYLQGLYDDLSDTAKDAQAGKDLKFRLDQAQAGLATAQAQYALAKAGPRSEQIAAAQAQAEASHAQADAAQAQVDAAQAALAVLDVQIGKLTLTAPAAGVILARTIEPGGLAVPGATLLVIGQLDDLTITVFVPEDRYGNVSLGQTAQVTVDSFPGVTFTGKVTHIADQAEFTPRNVQTATGRKTTVFAIKLSIDNGEGKLKPGMPADVKFGQ
jgi:HlyD family secretion protein